MASHRTRVAVLRGGPTSEYEVSLRSGAEVLKNLSPERYEARDIFIDKKSQWHHRGFPLSPGEVLPRVDVVFHTIHGEYGEDGQLQSLLDAYAVPYVGTGRAASGVTISKPLTKHALRNSGIRTPRHVVLTAEEATPQRFYDLYRSFPHPAFVKPADKGSSVGGTFAKSHRDLIDGVRKAHQFSEKALIEEFISGKEATVAVLDGFRGREYYALPPVEIVPPPKNVFFDYDAKYSGETEEICPGRFTEEEKRILEEAAIAVHRTLGLRHLSRSDFIVSPRRGIFFLEVNTLPGMTTESLFPKAAKAVGLGYPALLDHLIEQALVR